MWGEGRAMRNDKVTRERIITINKRLRPIRLAFLVEKDDKRTLREVFRLNTCLWGGIFNPIVPFFKRTPKIWEKNRFKLPTALSIVNGYLDAFEPDFLVVKDKTSLPNLLFDQERILDFKDVLDPNKDEPFSFGVDITEVYWDLYEKEFKFERRHPIKVFLSDPKKEMALFSACCFGEFPLEKRLEYIKKNYKHCFNPQEVQITEKKVLKCFVEKGASPLRLTKVDLRNIPNGGRDDPAIFFMDANSWLDLVDYWNLRAVGRNVLPLPKQFAEDSIEQCNIIIKRNYVPYRHNREMMHCTNFICSRASEVTELESFTKKLSSPGNGALSLQHWYPRIWDEWARGKDAVEHCLIESVEETEETAKREGYIRFKDLYPRFVEKYSGNGKPRWVNVISFGNDYRSVDFPSVLPHLKDIHRVLGAHGLNKLWSSREGVVVPCEHSDWSHFWNIPTSFKIFETWFKERGFQMSLSSAGRILLKMIQSVGGISATRSFQDENIINLLNQMSHSMAEVEIDGQTEGLSKSKVRAKTVSIKQWKDLLKKVNWSDEIAERNLQNLIGHKVLKCGLTIQCPECTQRTWYALGDLSEKLICERCLEEFDFPTNKPVPEGDWHYRTIGPFSVENYAYGGYCAALAIRFLADPLSAKVTWVPSFKIRNHQIGELEADFGMFLSQGRIGTGVPNLIFGESKTYNEFTKRDVDRMQQIANAFPGSVIVFCTLRSKLNSHEKKIISHLAKKGRKFLKAEEWINPVLILTGIEMFGDFGAPECWKDKGEPYSKFAKSYRGYNGIQELCNVTQQMHLGMESYWQWYEQERNKRLSRKKNQLQKSQAQQEQ